MKKDFANKLQELKKHSGVKQRDIAERLNLSDASVSQFMNGVALPRIDQLRDMMKLMRVPAEKANRMVFLLMVARAGGASSEPEKNQAQEPENLPAKSNRKSRKSTKWAFSVAEDDKNNETDENSESDGIPIVFLDSLKKIKKNTNFINFLNDHAIDFFNDEVSLYDNIAMIIARCDEIGLPFNGSAQVTIGSAELMNDSSLLLCCYEDGDILVTAADPENPKYSWCKTDKKGIRIHWQFPLTELQITPGNLFD